MVSVEVCGAPGPGVTVLGENEQLALAGSPDAQLSATGKLNPLTDDTVTVYVAVCPALMVARGGVAANVNPSSGIDSSSVADWLPLVPVRVNVTGFVLVPVKPVTVRVVVWPGVMDVGLDEHVTSLEHVKLMEPVNEGEPWTTAAPTVSVAEVALTKVTPLGPVELSEKSASAVALIVSEGDVPLMFDVMVMVPVFAPVEVAVLPLLVDVVGLKVTLMAQL